MGKNPEYVKVAFLDAVRKSSKEKKQIEFCKEILKLCSDKNLSGVSIDTLCYLALMNAGVKELNF